jgi:hypothetical protein
MSIQLEVKQALVILVNLVRVKLLDEVVKCCKHRRNKGLNTHVILRWELEDSETPLEDPKDPLDDIAS